MRNLLNYFKGDRAIWVMLVFLTIYSGLAVASSVVSLGSDEGRDVGGHIMKHMSLLAAGWVFVYVFHLIPYRWYAILGSALLVIAIALLAYTLVKGIVYNQAARWMSIPGTGLQFQTSDFAKVVLIISVARYLSRNQFEIENFKRGFLPVIIIISIVCGLILYANFSTAAILFGTCMILLYIGRVKVKYLLGLAGAGVLLFIIVLMIGKFAHFESRSRSGTWGQRFEQFFSKEKDPEKQFQSDKAKVAIVSGGLVGKFAGHSTQRHSLPQAFSDFIFAIIIEEYGFFFGALPLVFFYMILLRRAGVIVRKCDRTFPAFLVIGLMLLIIIQAMVNMGVSVGLFPVTGQTLPWVSKGGTSILFTAISLGIILGVSRSLQQEAKVEQG